jgi:intracellular septation protein
MSFLFLSYVLVEFGPLLAFFALSAVAGFYPGATALVVSTVAALLYSWFMHKRFAVFSLVVSVFVLSSGCATLYLREPFWLVLEFTLSNLAFSAILYAYNCRHDPVLKRLFRHMFLMSDRGWLILSQRWSLVFALVGVSNQLYWLYNPNEQDWTVFRFFVTLLTVIFALSQFPLARRERLPGATKWGMQPSNNSDHP